MLGEWTFFIDFAKRIYLKFMMRLLNSELGVTRGCTKTGQEDTFLLWGGFLGLPWYPTLLRLGYPTVV